MKPYPRGFPTGILCLLFFWIFAPQMAAGPKEVRNSRLYKFMASDSLHPHLCPSLWTIISCFFNSGGLRCKPGLALRSRGHREKMEDAAALERNKVTGLIHFSRWAVVEIVKPLGEKTVPWKFALPAFLVNSGQPWAKGLKPWASELTPMRGLRFCLNYKELHRRQIWL